MGDALNQFMQHREFVRCRTLGHAWDDVPVPSNEVMPGEAQIWLRCIHCHTIRKDRIGVRTGYLAGRSYDYPPDYQLSGEDLPTRDEWRLTLLDIAEQLADRRSRRNSTAKVVVDAEVVPRAAGE
jgi:hypothetical protein